MEDNLLLCHPTPYYTLKDIGLVVAWGSNATAAHSVRPSLPVKTSVSFTHLSGCVCLIDYSK